MPRPFASTVVLAVDQQGSLESLVRAGSTPQSLVFRCRIILCSARPEQPTNQQVADELDCDRHTVGLWRERYVTNGLTGLQDAPRSGRPRSFSPL
jgi:transposase